MALTVTSTKTINLGTLSGLSNNIVGIHVNVSMAYGGTPGGSTGYIGTLYLQGYGGTLCELEVHQTWLTSEIQGSTGYYYSDGKPHFYPYFNEDYFASSMGPGTAINIAYNCDKGNFASPLTSPGKFNNPNNRWQESSLASDEVDSPGYAYYRSTLRINNESPTWMNTMGYPRDNYFFNTSDAQLDRTVMLAGMGSPGTISLNISLNTGVTSFVLNSFYGSIVYKDGSSVPFDINSLPPEPSYISVGGSSTSEAVGYATVKFTRTGDLSFPASVSATTADGTALAGSDYTALSGTVDFAVGETSKTVQIPIIKTPDDIEGQEYFYVKITGADQGITLNNTQSTVYISSEVVTRTEDFDLRRNILRLDTPAGEGINDPGQGTQMDGREGQTIIIHGGCNGKGGYHIFLDPRPSRGPVYGDNTPGDFDDWRSVYQDGSTRVFMKEFIDDTHPDGHYELAIESCNSDGSWSRTEFNGPGLDTAFKGPGTKDLHISKNDGEITASVGWGTGTGWRETKSSGGDGGGVENTYVYVACPGPPVCVDQGFLGYIQGITAEGWVDPSHTMSGGTTPTGTTPSGATVKMVPGSSGTSTPDLIDTVVFDTYRLIGKTVNAVTTEFVWDTKRITSVPAEVTLDGERDIVYVDEVVLDTFRLIGKTVNLITIEFLWDTKRIVSKTVEVGPLDTSREISLTDWTSYDTSRETTGDRIADVTWDTKRTITTSDTSTLIQVVGFDTKRTIVGDAFNEVTFDTKRIIEGDEPGLPGVNIVFDTKRTITKSSDPVFIFDTKRKIKKEVTVYLDTKRFRNVTTIQTVRFDTKRRKTVTFWEIPEYDDYQ